MPVVNCRTGDVRADTPEEIATEEAERAAAAAAYVPREPAQWHGFTPRELLEALLTAMVQEGVFNASTAQAIATRTRNALRR